MRVVKHVIFKIQPTTHDAAADDDNDDDYDDNDADDNDDYLFILLPTKGL